jgi:hypothetical protein
VQISRNKADYAPDSVSGKVASRKLSKAIAFVEAIKKELRGK